MTPLLIGTALAIAALAFVLYPLIAGSAPASSAARGGATPAGAPAGSPPAGGGSAIEALREIEFDRATGKLSDADYDALKATYTREALAALRADESARAVAALAVEDPAEAAVLRYRGALLALPSCEVHGPRPEPDAVYCSDCGRYLAGKCAHCGAVVSQLGARFCTECGSSLAA
ncbi:MAG: zinc ribbon domain-containing protein [Gemmatimonadaceae bacterium]